MQLGEAPGLEDLGQLLSDGRVSGRRVFWRQSGGSRGSFEGPPRYLARKDPLDSATSTRQPAILAPGYFFLRAVMNNTITTAI